MDNHGDDNSPPWRILLATDLTSACDRALDRAVALARNIVDAIPGDVLIVRAIREARR